ncbi:hypothetical protein G7051_17625 [Dysgonomonas sp. HDW5B]|uniref:hypothetical protein n=1 Tax=Dysgonomonas sp. HDW5B TaxID=2714927 RepID=UPI00140A1AEC|nr:hypothetical protein [Dysgonomonas sp. HDW5B]QIK56081.1 hypothetical protein G7051_17625 [Dysgonomonas sp. HDW5B]
MKTKKKPTERAYVRTVGQMKQRVTPSNLQDVGLTISQFLDKMYDPQYKEEYFMKLVSQSKNETSVLADNDTMQVFFSIKIK